MVYWFTYHVSASETGNWLKGFHCLCGCLPVTCLFRKQDVLRLLQCLLGTELCQGDKNLLCLEDPSTSFGSITSDGDGILWNIGIIQGSLTCRHASSMLPASLFCAMHKTVLPFPKICVNDFLLFRSGGSHACHWVIFVPIALCLDFTVCYSDKFILT
jgi:hypothetical protein